MTHEALKAWRKRQGWTLDEAADYLGTTKTSVHRWEKALYQIPQTIALLAVLLLDKKNRRTVEKILRKPLD